MSVVGQRSNMVSIEQWRTAIGGVFSGCVFKVCSIQMADGYRPESSGREFPEVDFQTWRDVLIGFASLLAELLEESRMSSREVMTGLVIHGHLDPPPARVASPPASSPHALPPSQPVYSAPIVSRTAPLASRPHRIMFRPHRIPYCPFASLPTRITSPSRPHRTPPVPIASRPAPMPSPPAPVASPSPTLAPIASPSPSSHPLPCPSPPALPTS